MLAATDASRPSRPLRRRPAILAAIALLLCALSSNCTPVGMPPRASSTPEPSAPFGRACGGAHYWSDGTTGRTWDEARALCRSVGGDLASLHTEADRICANQALATFGSPPVGAWIGLHDTQREGAWSWSDGSRVDFTAWLAGEPNDDSAGPSDCAHLWRTAAFQWNDIACSRTDPTFLCRVP